MLLLLLYDKDDNDDPDRERGGGFTEAMRPERIVKLKCGHEFHEFCVRGWSIVGKQTVCPNCGADLVERTAKKGGNAGSRFLGCTNYPRCRFTKSAL